MADFSGFFKGLFIAICFSLACNTIEPLHKPVDANFQDKIPQLMEKFIEVSRPNRTVGSAGHEKAFEYIKAQFDEIATEIKGRVIIHEFTPDIEFAKRNYQNDFRTLIENKYAPNTQIYKKWKTFTDNAIAFLDRFKNIKGRNIILEIPGKRNIEEVIYVGAHYDTMDSDAKTLQFQPTAAAPGADDNASGIGVLLAVARELKNEHPDRTLRFVAFDFEEIFFLGSYALAKDLNGFKPRWMRTNEQTTSLFNLEMIGWSKTKLQNHPVLKLYTRQLKVPGQDQDTQLASAFTRAAALLKSPIKPVVLQNGFNRSDNWSFWQKSFPAICISQDWEKDFNKTHYHTPSDTLDTLNLDYIKEVARITTEMLSEIAHNSLLKPSGHTSKPDDIPDLPPPDGPTF